MTRSVLLAAAALLAAACSPAQAQLTTGQRIRVSAPDQGVYSTAAGTLLEVRPDSIVVEIRGLQRTLARSGITNFEVSRGERNDLSTVAVGGVVGLAGGYGAGWLHHKISNEGSDAGLFASEARDRRPLFALAGGALGALIGVLRPGDRWVPVRLEAVVTSATAGGAGVVLSYHF